jgi:geranylgeranyl diphosphate synthase type II
MTSLSNTDQESMEVISNTEKASRMESVKDIIEESLYLFLPKSRHKHDQKIIEAMHYSFTVGGKRLRPILILAAYRLIANDKDELIRIGPFMAAMEMIHTYSLIHDDLPAMDNDNLRRGKATCHVQFDEATAILAGDALLNGAYEVLISHTLKEFERDTPMGLRALNASNVLAEAAGIYGMIGGQGADMKFELETMESKADLDYIHEHKTGALIKAALVIGGILADADSQQLEKLAIIGKNIGLAFQIQDDILDISGNEALLGKPIGSDSKNNKKTYVSFVGLEKSIEDVNRLLMQAIEITHTFTMNNSLLLDIINFLKTREY